MIYRDKGGSGSVKITSGEFRGRKIQTPGGATHPMGERERLALFNLVGNDLTGCSVLDAFAGSGALGIEALSRGADEVVFVEKNNQARAVIKANLQSLEAAGRVVGGKVGEFEAPIRFDLIIADPPYDGFEVDEIQHLVELLAEDGRLVLSHPNEAPELTGASLEKTRQYAAAHLSVYSRI